MSHTVVPEILAKLEAWLAECIEAWNSQPVEGREPTLPATKGGKVNVRGVVRALGLKHSAEQHLFRHAELRAALDAVAIEQGLAPVGTRPEAEEIDKAIADRLKQVQARSGELSKVVAEQAATIERQRREISRYRAQLGLLESTGQVLRAEPRR